MKLYRVVAYDANSLSLRYNEANNLKKGLIVPSCSYLSLEKPNYNGDINTFYVGNKMSKFFYVSLADAITWQESLLQTGALVLEIDLPYEKIKPYIGLGFYTNSRLEVCIPYDILYKLLNGEYNFGFNIALRYYNEHDIAEITSSTSYQSLLDLLPKDLSHQKALSYVEKEELLLPVELYQYLCFSSHIPYETINLPYEMVSEKEKIVQNIVSKRPKEFKANITASQNFSKSFVEEWAIPYLEMENKEVRRVLDKKEKIFPKRSI